MCACLRTVRKVKMPEYAMYVTWNVDHKNASFDMNKKITGRDRQPLLSECDKKYRCERCLRVIKMAIRPRHKHQCGEMFCSTCKEVNKCTF